MRACLRDKRLGRNFRHVGSEEEFARPASDSRSVRSPTSAVGLCSSPSRRLVKRGTPRNVERLGGGIHVCIGAPLARIELEASLRTLVERAPGVNVKLQSNDHRSTSETGR